MKTFQEFKKEALKDPAVKKAYDDLAPEFELASMLIEKRLERGLSQAELAEKIGTKQPAIARLESGNYNTTLAFLKKAANALGAELHISLR
ncbi:MAG: transcriptional regulator [Candidatus Magasanikbacteria bacterium CG11_big_fil_rev_8_21_14_0_20_43_7]|uniref:Transcriptional regulator n=1 Tax=Candidatus Magasanikbacteria bacterium CG11_big_fil_rev_8_21_14_0_20_43_7 TaxID=1974654 RepID=A0A2H0N3G9_9BACT|nr:MAG: transcriptional regulator [Candidatus Magasanikbacteria bacterium CG11_big_fil_rev_8_21_14_0_20_43_7]